MKSLETYSTNRRSTSGLTIFEWHMFAKEDGVPGKQPLCIWWKEGRKVRTNPPISGRGT